MACKNMQIYFFHHLTVENLLFSPVRHKGEQFVHFQFTEVKHELWLKLHETTTSCSLQKGQEALREGSVM